MGIVVFLYRKLSFERETTQEREREREEDTLLDRHV